MHEEARGPGDLGSPRLWRRRRPRHRSRPANGDGGASRSGGSGSSQVYGALDLGTNNCRLLIARPAGDGFRVIDAFSRIVRLGEGVSASGRLGPAAIERALGALAICSDKIRRRGVTRARLIATEACRAAENGPEFLARVRDEVGIELDVVDRETEARLAATGCTPLVDPRADGVILFDIGGGSTEIVHLGQPMTVSAGPPAPEISAWTSMAVGVVTVAERFGGVTVSPASFHAMVGHVKPLVEAFAARLPGSVQSSNLHLLGTSGTVTTIAGVHLGLARYDRSRVDGCWMDASAVTSVTQRLLAMSYEERVANACIGAERADLVLAGCAILEAIRSVFPFPRLRVADRGLREGILVQLMREDAAWDRPAIGAA